MSGATHASTETAAVQSLGGDDATMDYHPLAMDPQSDGLWGFIDRTGEQLSGWLNPILIKEARQSLKSRQFIITFSLLLLASCFWTILGIVANAPDVYYLPSGTVLLTGYYFVLAIPLIGMVPLAAHRSLAAEIDDDTFEMLIITRLSAMRIVMGKLNSAMLQMLIYFAAIVPCLAFSYLLRGVTLPTIAMLIVVIFFTAMLLTAFALMLATLAPNRAAQTLVLLGLLAVLVIAEFICAAFCLDVILPNRMDSLDDALLFLSSFVLIGMSCIVIFIKAAAARIAPVTENRSTGLRRTMFVQQLIWIAVMAFLVMWYEEPAVMNFALMILGAYWLLMGTLMLGESPELSPRVLRQLPSTFFGRSFLTWFNPGPGTGYVFAICTGTTSALVTGMFAIQFKGNNPDTDPLTFSLIISGYLMAYLGITRLIAMPITRRIGHTMVVPIAIVLMVLVISAMSPLVIWVVTTGSPPSTYTDLEAINWTWTLIEAFEDNYSTPLAFLIFVVGGVITMANMGLLMREFRYRKITAPQRVISDQEQEKLHGSPA